MSCKQAQRREDLAEGTGGVRVWRSEVTGGEVRRSEVTGGRVRRGPEASQNSPKTILFIAWHPDCDWSEAEAHSPVHLPYAALSLLVF